MRKLKSIFFWLYLLFRNIFLDLWIFEEDEKEGEKDFFKFITLFFVDLIFDKHSELIALYPLFLYNFNIKHKNKLLTLISYVQ